MTTCVTPQKSTNGISVLTNFDIMAITGLSCFRVVPSRCSNKTLGRRPGFGECTSQVPSNCLVRGFSECVHWPSRFLLVNKGGIPSFHCRIAISSQPQASRRSLHSANLVQHHTSYMPSRAALNIAIAAVLLELLPLSAAHGDDHMDVSAQDAPKLQVPGDGQLGSYWRLSEHATLMYWHIALEILAWVAILPIGGFSEPNQINLS
jgi:hypothetical protein